MKEYLLLIILIFFGCAGIRKPEGLYINYILVKENATVEDFCKAKAEIGQTIELVRYNKTIFSRRAR